MKKQQLYVKRIRKFLNSDSGMAAINLHVRVPLPFHELEDSYGYGFDSNLTLSDCGRQITLDFDAYTEKDVRQRLAKIDRIREGLDLIEQGLLDYLPGVATVAERHVVNKAQRKGGTHGIAIDDE